MKFLFEYAGVYYDLHRHMGRLNTRLHGIVTSGTIAQGDLIELPTRSERAFVGEVMGFMDTLRESGALGWFTKYGFYPDHRPYWILVEGVPAAQDIVCPGVACSVSPLDV